MPISEVYNMDCMEYMRNIPDKFFELAVVDPPYGIGETWKKDKLSKAHDSQTSYKNNEIPKKEYFDELIRVSKNQIIWGANYYTQFLIPRNSWIVWDKMADYNLHKKSEGELAWTSFNIPLRIIQLSWNGFCRCCKRSNIHPHEKPVNLYAWVFKNYAKPGDKILDTHLGSGSSRISAYKMGFDFYATEIDKEYFEAQDRRFKEACLGQIETGHGTLVQKTLFEL